MAIDLQVAGVTVKKQSALGVLGLGIITLGIYVLFWVYRVNREMRDIGVAYNDRELAAIKPGVTLLMSVIPIVNLFAIHFVGTRIQRVQTLTGRGADYSLALHWILVLFTGLWFCYAQHALSSTYDWFDRSTRPSTPLLPGQVPVAPTTAVGGSMPSSGSTPSVGGPPPTGGPFVG